ncbi:hypothetical protein [Streptomyces composti]|uniref:hypothetical protein n=1 Tax=Streptomyces composti TaxID=2720025 RepID=UPI0019D033EA|nr:hypothetical protein [Streptomyces composti]
MAADQSSEEPAPESSAIPDDVWEKFARDSERDIRASAPREPSARARMVTERLRAMDEQRAREGANRRRRWGRRRTARPAEPEGWRTGPPILHAVEGRRSRRRTVWSIVGVLLAAALALVAVKPGLLSRLPGLGGLLGESSEESAAASPLAPESARPTGPPAEGPGGTPTRERPFAGSPAARWESGADAIRLPEAKPVGGVSAERIEDALRRTKEFLVAANLDPQVLRGGEPKKALALVDPVEKDYLRQLRAGLRKPTAQNDPVVTFSRFDPGQVEILDDVRVRGRMTVEPARGASGKAVIKADYTFVYAALHAGGGDEVARTIVRRGLEVSVLDLAEYQGTEGRLWISDVRSEIGNDDCKDGDGVIRPQFLADRQTNPGTTGAPVDPYDRSRELPGGGTGGCGVVSRS